jgi:hypothetical protein
MVFGAFVFKITKRIAIHFKNVVADRPLSHRQNLYRLRIWPSSLGKKIGNLPAFFSILLFLYAYCHYWLKKPTLKGVKIACCFALIAFSVNGCATNLLVVSTQELILINRNIS